MFSLIHSIKTLLGRSVRSIQDRDEQYLAEACDVHDLERRMRQLDSGRQNLYAIGASGIFTR